MGRLFAFEKDKPRMAADLFLISEKMHLLTHKWDIGMLQRKEQMYYYREACKMIPHMTPF